MARVAIIEDNVPNLTLMAYLLTAAGHAPMGYRDGRSGLDAVRRDAPDLVLCDIQLPQLSGYGIAEALRADPATRQVPLIAVSALAMRGDRERALAAGFRGYIEKPIQPELFVTQVEAFLPAALRKGGIATAGTAGTAGTPAPAAPAREAQTGPLILAVDDVVGNLSLIEAIFQGAGFRVRCARDIGTALDVMRAERPDVVLSDLHMPGGGGITLRRATLGDPALARIPFVFISSTGVEAREREQARDIGVTQVLERPMDPQQLLNLVKATFTAG